MTVIVTVSIPWPIVHIAWIATDSGTPEFSAHTSFDGAVEWLRPQVIDSLGGMDAFLYGTLTTEDREALNGAAPAQFLEVLNDVLDEMEISQFVFRCGVNTLKDLIG